MTQLAQAYIAIRANHAELRGDLASIKSMLTSNLVSMGQVAGGALAALGITQAISGVKGLASSFLSANSSIEQYRVSLGVLFKDQERANRFIEEAQRVAIKTPFETSEIIQSAIVLRGYGFEIEELIPLIQKFGNAAAAMPGGLSGGLERIFRQLGQMKQKGRVMLSDLNPMIENGVPAIQILKEEFGMAFEDIQKSVRDGKIGIDQVIAALAAGVEKRFGGMMDKVSQTFNGLISSVRDVWSVIQQKVGAPIFNEMVGGLQKLVAAISSNDAMAFYDELGKKIETFAGTVKSALSNPIAQAVMQFASLQLAAAAALGLIAASSSGLAVAGSIIGAMLSPIGMLISLLAALGYSFKAALQSESGQTMLDTLSAIGGLAREIAGNMVNAFYGAMTYIAEAFTGLFGTSLPEAYGAMWSGFLEWIRKAIDAVALFTTDFGLSWEYIKTAMSLKLSEMMTEVLLAWDTIKGYTITVGEVILAAFGAVWSQVVEIFVGLKDMVVGIMEAIWAAIKSIWNGEGLSEAWDKGINSLVERLASRKDQSKGIGEEASRAWREGDKNFDFGLEGERRKIEGDLRDKLGKIAEEMAAARAKKQEEKGQAAPGEGGAAVPAPGGQAEADAQKAADPRRKGKGGKGDMAEFVSIADLVKRTQSAASGSSAAEKAQIEAAAGIKAINEGGVKIKNPGDIGKKQGLD